MALGKSGQAIYLILGGAILLVFVVGLLCGGWLFSRWQQPAGVTTSVTLATVVPGGSPSTGEQPLSTPAGSTAAPCSPPAGWTLYTVRPGDTLSQLAERAGVSQEQVLAVNCLTSPDLLAGATLYLPSPPTPTPCAVAPLPGWGLYTVQPGDSLSALAAARNIPIEEVERRNCLASADILQGQQLYLPLLPTPTPCAVAPPSNWGLYTVQTGDTLFSLAAARGATADQVKQVNCLADETIQVGQQLYLPLLPTPVPTIPPPPTQPPATLSAMAAPGDVSAGVAPSQPGAGSVAAGDVPGSGGQPLPGGGEPPVGIQSPPAGASDFPQLLLDFHGFWAAQPCQQQDVVQPYLELWVGILQRSEVELGERAYFFICNLLEKPTSAIVTWPNSQVQGTDLFGVVLSDPASEPETPKNAAVWPALPFYPIGAYTMTVTSPSTLIPSFPFTVTLPTTRHILAVPPAGFPGDTFQVYYVGVPPGLNIINNVPPVKTVKVEVDLKESTSPQKPSFLITINKPFNLDIDLDPDPDPKDGWWGMIPLYLGRDKTPGIYDIIHQDVNGVIIRSDISLRPRNAATP